jgi:hypothetical protein
MGAGMSSLPNNVIRLTPPSLRQGYCPSSWQEFANDLVCGTFAQHSGQRGTTFYSFGGTSPYPPPPTPPPPPLTCPGSWAFDFVATESLTPSVGPTPTFERSTTGTYFDSSGVLQTAAIDTPRFTYRYNGSSWVAKGLLIEPDTNTLMGPSEDFTNAAWQKTGVTVTKDVIAAPDGTTTGNQVFETAVNNVHAIGQSRTDTVGGTSLSCFFKQGTARYVYLYAFWTSGAVGRAVVVADLQTGAVTLSQSLFLVPIASYNAYIENVGNGWYRLCLQTSFSSTFASMSIGISNSATPTLDANLVPVAYLGNPANYVYAWGFQFESATSVTSYIKHTTATTSGTGTVAVPRDDDKCYIDAGTFSALWNPAEGSIYAEYEHHPILDLGQQYFTGPASVVVDPPNNTDYIYLLSVSESSGSGDTIQQFRSDFQIDSATGPGSFQNIKIAAGLKDNDFALSVNGAAVVKDLTGTLLNTVGAFYIGPVKILTDCPPVTISKVRYYTCRLTDEELAEITA